MFELFKLLQACAHIAHPIFINDSILFVFEDKIIRLQATMVEGIYDVYENDIYLEAMTEKEVLGEYVIRKFNN